MNYFIPLFWLVCFGAWVANIVKFVYLIGGEVTTMFIVRLGGIIVAPLGVVLGFI